MTGKFSVTEQTLSYVTGKDPVTNHGHRPVTGKMPVTGRSAFLVTGRIPVTARTLRLVTGGVTITIQMLGSVIFEQVRQLGAPTRNDRLSSPRHRPSRNPSDVINRCKWLGWSPSRSAARVTLPPLAATASETSWRLSRFQRLVVLRHGRRRRGPLRALEQRLRQVLGTDDLVLPQDHGPFDGVRESSRTLPGHG